MSIFFWGYGKKVYDIFFLKYFGYNGVIWSWGLLNSKNVSNREISTSEEEVSMGTVMGW